MATKTKKTNDPLYQPLGVRAHMYLEECSRKAVAPSLAVLRKLDVLAAKRQLAQAQATLRYWGAR